MENINIKSVQHLINHINSGTTVKYVFFWGHQKPKTGISKSCFSQWYEASFEVDSVVYRTAEHYMMAEKARLFHNVDIVNKIIAANNPGKAKRLGRAVKGFDEQVWQQHRVEIVINGNFAKFSQNPEIKTFLLNTGDRVLVEASPVDAIWGIGLAADNPNAMFPEHWLGLNLLGFALMEVRERLQSEM